MSLGGRGRYSRGTTEQQIIDRHTRAVDRQLGYRQTKQLLANARQKEKPMAFDMSNYVDVATRVKILTEQYPNASIVCTKPIVIDIQGQTFIEVTAHVACNDGSNRNAVASAWEIFPGRTSFTKDSEMMNAETSAVGRAIGMLNIGITGSMASANEVQNRQGVTVTQQGETRVTQAGNPPSDKQLWLFKKLLKDAGQLPPVDLASWDKFRVSKAIEQLKAGDEPAPDYPTEMPEEPF